MRGDDDAALQSYFVGGYGGDLLTQYRRRLKKAQRVVENDFRLPGRLAETQHKAGLTLRQFVLHHGRGVHVDHTGYLRFAGASASDTYKQSDTMCRRRSIAGDDGEWAAKTNAVVDVANFCSGKVMADNFY